MVEGLQRFGLTDEEARIYVQLLWLGKGRASEVAQATGVNRSKAYRILDALGSRGIVRHGFEQPRKYWAEPPSEVLQDLLSQRRRELDALREVRSMLEAPLERLADHEPDGPARLEHRVLQGRRAIHRQGIEMLKHAEASIRGLTTHTVGLGLAESTGTLSTAVDRVQGAGVTMQVLFGDQPGVREKLESLTLPPGAEIRLSPITRTLRFILTDDEHLVLWGASAAGQGLKNPVEVGITTNAPSIIAAYLELFERAWDEAAAIG